MASIGIETFGGNGFIEDWAMERQYRDAQNHPMWEGTEIVLSMDVLRALPTCLAALLNLFQSIQTQLSSSSMKSQQMLGAILLPEISALSKTKFSMDMLSSGSRFSNLLCDLTELALLCEQALWSSRTSNQYRSFIVAAFFANRYFLPRENTWTRAVAGGYPKTRDVFNELTTGAIISADIADAAVIELLSSHQPKL